MTRAEREAKKLAEELGLIVLGITTTGGNHIKLELRRPQDCRSFHSIFPLSRSDHRGAMNKRAELRRIMAGTWNPWTGKPEEGGAPREQGRREGVKSRGETPRP
jgi:hypothetical protein